MGEDCLAVMNPWLHHRLPDPNATKILIGEVSLINSTVIKKFLEKLGYRLIVQVDNGIDAVSLAEKEKFNVIFLDLRMPVIGGIEATKLIRRHERDKNKISTTVVGLTTVYSDIKKETFYKSHGMDCLLRLPLHITDLKNVLEKYGHPKTIDTLKHLVMMYITNQPHLFHYNTHKPNSITYKRQEYFLAADVLEELHDMKESFPILYKYPNFDGIDSSEILVRVSNDYHSLKEGLVSAIGAGDMGAVRRSATAMATILRYVSFDAENAALEMIACKDSGQALEFLQALTLYMDSVWE